MRNLSEADVTEAARARIDDCPDPRLKQVMDSLIRHLHGFVREVEPTEAEWFTAIEFLTATGQMCDDKRQEFILLSDVLGVSMLLDGINHRGPQGATESTVLGPFYIEGAEVLPNGASIAKADGGEPCVVSGRVSDANGRPIAGAFLDVWQTDARGLYDIQDPKAPPMNLRGKFVTDAEGRYAFRAVKPVSYPVPTDGPVGRLLRALGRHPYRPAHIHFIVSAEGYEPVTTHLFVKGDPYLDSDVVFGVKDSLVVDFVHREDREPHYAVSYDFGLKPASHKAASG